MQKSSSLLFDVTQSDSGQSLLVSLREATNRGEHRLSKDFTVAVQRKSEYGGADSWYIQSTLIRIVDLSSQLDTSQNRVSDGISQ